jgi:hypothetical protein
VRRAIADSLGIRSGWSNLSSKALIRRAFSSREVEKTISGVKSSINVLAPVAVKPSPLPSAALPKALTRWRSALP